MKLITKEVEKNAKKFPLYSQDGKGDEAIVWVKFFFPVGRYTAYVTEMNVEEDLAFGYCLSPHGEHCDEWGYFSISEWNEFVGPMGLGMERDRHFTPLTVGELKAQNYRA